MVIEKLNLCNYRNYETLDLNVDSKTNILYGDNAQGKTNILEAIYICSTTKSHRGGKDKEVIKSGCDDAQIKIIMSMPAKGRHRCECIKDSVRGNSPDRVFLRPLLFC